jgi:hypothetical protein
MKRLALLATLLLAAPAGAELLDPPNLHISGPGGFSQNAGGADWVTYPTFDGTFSITNVDNNQVAVGPFHIVLAIPNVTGSILDTITRVGTTDVNISPVAAGGLTSGSAYDALGISAAGVPASARFNNFVSAYEAVVGGPAPTVYGLYDLQISLASLFLLSKYAVRRYQTLEVPGFQGRYIAWMHPYDD